MRILERLLLRLFDSLSLLISNRSAQADCRGKPMLVIMTYLNIIREVGGNVIHKDPGRGWGGVGNNSE